MHQEVNWCSIYSGKNCEILLQVIWSYVEKNNSSKESRSNKDSLIEDQKKILMKPLKKKDLDFNNLTINRWFIMGYYNIV